MGHHRRCNCAECSPVHPEEHIYGNGNRRRQPSSHNRETRYEEVHEVQGTDVHSGFGHEDEVPPPPPALPALSVIEEEAPATECRPPVGEQSMPWTRWIAGDGGRWFWRARLSPAGKWEYDFMKGYMRTGSTTSSVGTSYVVRRFLPDTTTSLAVTGTATGGYGHPYGQVPLFQSSSGQTQVYQLPLRSAPVQRRQPPPPPPPPPSPPSPPPEAPRAIEAPVPRLLIGYIDEPPEPSSSRSPRSSRIVVEAESPSTVSRRRTSSHYKDKKGKKGKKDERDYKKDRRGDRKSSSGGSSVDGSKIPLGRDQKVDNKIFKWLDGLS